VRRTGEEHARRQRHHGTQPSVQEQVTTVLSELGVTAGEDLLGLCGTVHSHARLRACPEPMTGIVPTLGRLRAAGHVLVLSSNTLTCPGTVTRQILDRHGITPFFHHLCFSDELGVAKPHRDFYTAVTAVTGRGAEDILHVGDDWRTDILGAAGAGCRALWFNPAGAARPAVPPGNPAVEGVHELRRLQELTGWAAGGLPEAPSPDLASRPR
jgi:FMN phosphatase YigB (HAD superfamily)